MQTGYTISEDLQDDLQRFLTFNDTALLSQSLRRLFIDFLDYELTTGVALYLEELLLPFNSLLDLLDAAAKEWQEYNMHNRLHELPEQQPPATKDKVIAFLAASLSPSALFLLYHNSDDNTHQYFDLLAVIPPASKTSFAQYEQVITMANMDDAVINVSLHKEEIIQQQLKEGHIYFSIACSKKNLVYAANAFQLPEPDKAALQLPAEKAIIEFDTAHKKAGSFLQGASNYRGESDNVMAAFMLQQAVELTLRGLITALLGSCIKTHCLRELKKPINRCVPEITYLFVADEAEENRLLLLLEKAYKESRYNSQFTINDRDIDLLSEQVEALHERAAVLFKEKISVISGLPLPS
ncbi:MAG: HEPN domain-containing protein [Parafilimonas sp.]